MSGRREGRVMDNEDESWMMKWGEHDGGLSSSLSQIYTRRWTKSGKSVRQPAGDDGLMSRVGE